MSTKLYLGTRKGLIEAERSATGWRITRNSFLGVQVPMLLPDARDGTLYAAPPLLRMAGLMSVRRGRPAKTVFGGDVAAGLGDAIAELDAAMAAADRLLTA